MIVTTKLPPLPPIASLLGVSNVEEELDHTTNFLANEAYKSIAERDCIVLSESHKKMLFELRIKIVNWLSTNRMNIHEVNQSAIEWWEHHDNFINKELVERLRYSVEVMVAVSEFLSNLYTNLSIRSEMSLTPEEFSYERFMLTLENIPENKRRFVYGLSDSTFILEFIEIGYIYAVKNNKQIDEQHQKKLIELLKKHTSEYKRCAKMSFNFKGLPELILPKLERDVIEWKEFIAETLGSISDESALPDRSNWIFTERILPE